MMKKILIVGVMVMGWMSAVAGNTMSPVAENTYDEKDLNDHVNDKYYYWESEIFGEMPEMRITPGGIFDDPEDLLAIAERITQANNQGMNYTQFSDFANELNQYIVDHPKYTKNAYMHLGHLYNAVNPSTLRNRQRALTYYQQVANGVNNRTDKAQLYLLMASCYNLGGGKCNINRMGNYYIEAAKADPRFASFMGNLYMFGWGTFADLNLAAHFFTIGMINGDRGAVGKLRAIQYISEKRNPTPQDSAGFASFEQYAYLSRICGEKEKAFSCVQASAQKGFVPAYYNLAYMYHYQMPHQAYNQEMKELVFKWLRKGANKRYAPCMTALAHFAMAQTCDTAKGFIFKPDHNGKYSDRDRKIVAQQSMELLWQACSEGSNLAMTVLGERFEQGNEFGFPEKNLRRALLCYRVADKCGSKVCRERYEQMYRDHGELIGESYLEMIDEDADKIVQDVALKIQDIFRKIESSSVYGSPTIFQNSYTLSNSSEDITEDDPLFGANLALGYQTAYEMYVEYLMEMSHHPNGYKEWNGELYQNLMRNLRMHALRLPVPEEIKQSRWENWVGE